MSMYGIPQGISSPPRRSPATDEDALLETPARLGPAPGTMVLVLVFLAAFVTYYFANWKLLSFLWKIG